MIWENFVAGIGTVSVCVPVITLETIGTSMESSSLRVDFGMHSGLFSTIHATSIRREAFRKKKNIMKTALKEDLNHYLKLL